MIILTRTGCGASIDVLEIHFLYTSFEYENILDLMRGQPACLGTDPRPSASDGIAATEDTEVSKSSERKPL